MRHFVRRNNRMRVRASAACAMACLLADNTAASPRCASGAHAGRIARPHLEQDMMLHILEKRWN